MRIKQIEKKFLIRLEKDEKLVEQLNIFCQQYNIKQGLIFGIGALTQATIGYFEIKTKTYHWQDFAGDLEVTSLTGNIALLKGKPTAHLHINISDESLKVYGGHLKEGIVGGTLELAVSLTEGEMERELDEKIGLNLLKI